MADFSRKRWCPWRIADGGLGLTGLGFSLKLRAMSVSLDSLERKVVQMLSVCDSLRAENEALRLRVASLDAEKATLTAKIDTTAARLETLMAGLPEE